MVFTRRKYKPKQGVSKPLPALTQYITLQGEDLTY